MIDRTRWPLVLLIWAAGLGAAAQYGKISVVFDRMPSVYPDAGAWLGFAVSLVGLLGILLGVAAGAYVAAIGFRRTLVVALWTGAAMSALQALHLPIGLFMATRVIEGISHLGLVVAGPTLIAQISAERDRGATLTLWSTFFGVAFAILAWAGLPFADRHGVLALFWVHAGVMAVLALGLSRVLRDVAALPRAPMPGLADLPGLHAAIYRSPRVAAPGAGWLFYTCCFLAILTVLPPHIAPQWRAFVIGAMPVTSILVSMTLGVWLLRRYTAVQVVQAGFLLSAGCMVWLWVAPGQPAACLGLAAALGLVQGASFAAVAQLNHGAVDRARANGGLAQAGNLGNTLGTPLMLAALSAAGFTGLVLASIVLLLSGAVVHAVLERRRNV